MIGRVRSSEPQIQGPTFDQTTLNVSLSAAWQVTEKWTLTLRASEISSKYAYTPPPTSIDVAATGFTVLLSRRFDRVTWH